MTQKAVDFVAAGEALTDLIRVAVESWVSVPGGATWNVAQVMAGLGVSSAFAGAISRDCFGDSIFAASEHVGMDTRFLQRNDKNPLIAVVPETHPPQYFFLGNDTADLAFDPALLPAGWMDSVKCVHFCGISLVREPLAQCLIKLAEALKARGVIVSYDPNVRALMGPDYRATFWRMCELASVIKVSDEDIDTLFGAAARDEVLARIKTQHPDSLLLVTRGADGAQLYRRGAAWSAVPPAIEVVDTVGAGDASLAGFLYSLIYRSELGPAAHLRFAIAGGTAACLQQGAAKLALAEIAALADKVVSESMN